MDDEKLLELVMDIMIDEDSPERVLKKVASFCNNDMFRAKAAIMRARSRLAKSIEE